MIAHGPRKIDARTRVRYVFQHSLGNNLMHMYT